MGGTASGGFKLAPDEQVLNTWRFKESNRAGSKAGGVGSMKRLRGGNVILGKVRGFRSATPAAAAGATNLLE